jgi:hypothetical protein
LTSPTWTEGLTGMDTVNGLSSRDIEFGATIIAGPAAFQPMAGEGHPEIVPEGRALSGLGVRRADGAVARFGTDIYRHRRSRPIKLRDLREPAQLYSGRLIYGGVIGSDFGHQITQSMGRLWVCDEFPEAEIAFLAGSQGFPALPGYFVDLIRILGVTNPIRLLCEPLKVDELVVPQDMGNLHRRPSIDPAFAEWLAHRRPERPVDPDLCIYVSRSGLPLGNGQYLQEMVLEAALAAEGYRIIRPEEMTIHDQVELYLTAGRLIFADGSAVHLWSLFGHHAQRAAMVLRRPLDRHILRWFNGLPGSELSYHDHRVADFSRRGGPSGKSAALLDLRALWQDLRDAGFHHSATDIGLPRAELDRWIEAIQGKITALEALSFDLDERSRKLLGLRPRALPSSPKDPA